MTRIPALALGALLLALPGCSWWGGGSEPQRFDSGWAPHHDLEPSVLSRLNHRLARNTDVLKAKLQDAVILEAVRQSNRENQVALGSQIMIIEERWKNPRAIDPIVVELLGSDCSRALRVFRESFPDFTEVFVTNRIGTNVCLTNKTSDYYQADEEWWQTAFQTGRPSRGHPEYDASARLVAVPLYVPVIDPETKEVIGVGKGLVRREVVAQR